jgi:hypothetical protein
MVGHQAAAAGFAGIAVVDWRPVSDRDVFEAGCDQHAL